MRVQLGGEIGIATDHQALAGEVRCGDACHVALIEQRELQRAAIDQPPDRAVRSAGASSQAG